MDDTRDHAEHLAQAAPGPPEENATVRGRAWSKLLDAPVLTLNVTVSNARGASLIRNSAPPRTLQ